MSDLFTLISSNQQHKGNYDTYCLDLDLLPQHLRCPDHLGCTDALQERPNLFGDSFLVNEPLADSINHLLVVGFYLVNFGYVVMALKSADKPVDLQGVLETRLLPGQLRLRSDGAKVCG